MIDVQALTKRYGRVLAVDDLSFSVRPGSVTAFLGPNGAGKSTTMRLALGLAAPTSGEVTIDGRRYAGLRYPLRVAGALLDPSAVDQARTARNHLAWLARSQRIDPRRVDDLLGLVGLEGSGNRPVGRLSLGMKQRLGIAAALIGDPPVLILDEPMNGLDPDGIRWIRLLLRSLAAEGRTVLVSSHLLAEVAVTADRLVIIGQGRLLADTTTELLAGERASGRGDRGPIPAPGMDLEAAYLDLVSGSQDRSWPAIGRAR